MTMLRNPRIAAITALVLCLPIVIILSLITLGVESDIVRQVRVLNGGASRLGSVISLGAILLLTIPILLLFLSIVGAFVVDQLPCWAGVPNCD